MAKTAKNRPPVRSVAWPSPLPGRVGWAWLLRLPWRRRRVRRILGLLRGRVPSASVLADVGGGTGVGAEEVTRVLSPTEFQRRLVLDPQRGMLLRAPRRPERPGAPELVVADAARLPLADESVDVLLSLGVLCCMNDEAVPSAVSETWRVLRPGGFAVVSVPLRRGDADEPLFQAAGFRTVQKLRPGRSLYQRPAES